ncbi:MAG: linear amide C-N hydrolase, partial [Gemmiger qucibialis]
MCTAATYQTKDFYFGRNLDYEFGYGETVTFTPRHYPFQLNGLGVLDQHYAILGMAC